MILLLLHRNKLLLQCVKDFLALIFSPIYFVIISMTAKIINISDIPLTTISCKFCSRTFRVMKVRPKMFCGIGCRDNYEENKYRSRKVKFIGAIYCDGYNIQEPFRFRHPTTRFLEA